MSVSGALDPTKVPPVAAQHHGWLRSNADLLSTPIIVLLGLGAVALWVSTRKLDDIEARALQSSAILTDLGEHLVLTTYSTFFVIVIAVPLGILLSRRRARHR